MRPAIRNLFIIVVGGFVALVVVVHLVVSSRERRAQREEAADRSPCEQAWADAERRTKADPYRDTQETLRPTLTACKSVSDWDAANIATAADMGEGAFVIDNLCEGLGVTSLLCAEAHAASPMRVLDDQFSGSSG